jgi:N-acetylglucosaminyl-diphospho-decaprenol L-rhamnosyltransferase
MPSSASAATSPRESSSGDGATCLASVLVVSYRTRELTRACLRSVLENVSGIPYEVIVVDNGSGDGSAAMIAEEFPAARLIALEDNVGFAAGVNLAAEHATGEFLVLLNPDAEVLPGAVEKLVEFARAHPDTGIVGGRTLGPDGSVDPRSCRAVPSVWGMTCYGLGLSTALKENRLFDPESLGRWQRDTVREVGYVTGCFMAVPRHVWERLGGFDERFFVYSEDVDLAVRARRLGYRSMVTPDASVVHHFGASSADGGAKGVMQLRARATFIRKHWSPPVARFGLAMLWLGAAVRAAATGVSGRLPGRAGSRRSNPWLKIWAQRRTWLPGFPTVPVRRAGGRTPPLPPRSPR